MRLKRVHWKCGVSSGISMADRLALVGWGFVGWRAFPSPRLGHWVMWERTP